MKEAKISVIVPVYKVEEYLSRCIDSILGQTCGDLELLLIDDGSPDKSGEICDEYAAQDARVRVFHKENGGVSSARNLGIENAKGDWVMFVDGDDWVDVNTIEYASRYFDDSDLIRFSYKSILSEDGQQEKVFGLKTYDTKESFMSDAITQRTYVAVWGALYKKELFAADVRFDTSIPYGEDWLVFVELLSKSRSFKTVDEPMYFYNQYNQNSCTSAASIKKKCTVFSAFEEVSRIVDKNFYSKELLQIKLIVIYRAFVPVLFCHDKIKMTEYVFNHVSYSYGEILHAQVKMKIKVLLSLFLLYRKCFLA